MINLRRAAPLFIAVGALACSQGDKREFLDPELPKNSSILARVVVSQAPAGLVTEQMTRFTAYGRSSSGDSIPVEVTWQASGGTINNEGYFVADQAGSYFVKAFVTNRPEMADSVSVSVVRHPPRLLAILIDPSPVSLAEGDTQSFSAIGYYDDGTSKVEAVDWTTSGGEIDANGIYVANTAEGEYDVTATARNEALTLGVTRVRVAKREASLSFDISPSSVTLTPGQSVTFSGVQTWDDLSTTSPAISWSATGGNISSVGKYTAGSVAGNYRVIGKVVGGKRADTVSVTIQTLAIASIAVTPGTATLAPGGSVKFVAAGIDVGGNVRPVSVNWTAAGGTINSNGNFIAGSQAGSYKVIAQLQGGTNADTSTVTITAGTPTLSSLTLIPNTATVAAGGSYQFAVTAQWSDGSTAVPPVSYTATGGTVTSAGVYTAGTGAGTYRVIATHSGGKADTSAVTVTAPSTVSVSVSPKSVTVSSGASQQFTASALLSTGTTATSVSWSATGGTISASGLYTAGSVGGAFVVIGKHGGVADTVPVTVQAAAPTLTSLTLTPATVTVTAGGTQQFAVAGLWSDGGTGTPPVSWSATGGTITSGGKFTAGSSNGTYRVIAKYVGGGVADTSVVTVTAPALVTLAVSPHTLTVPAGGTQQFAAAGTLSNGNNATPQVGWTATGGTISSAGVFKAGSVAGTYRVVGKELNGSLADTSLVTISATAPTLSSLTVSPSSASVSAGGTKQFAVAGTLSDGSSITPAVTWSATGGTITSGGLFSAGTVAGTYQAIAKVQGGTLADTTSITVTAASAPTLTGLLLTPHSVSVSVNGVFQLSAVATMSDGSATPVTPSYSATGGTISATGLYTAGSATGNYQVIATYQGKADTSVVTIAAAASYQTIYGDDYNQYADDAAVKAAYSNNKLHELWSFSTVPWAKTGLVADNVFGKALKTVQDVQAPYYDLAKYPSGMPGATTRMRVIFTQKLSHIWVRFYVKFGAPASNPIGFRTKSPNDPSPYGGAYKVFFLHWPSPMYERGALVYSNTQRLDAQFYVHTLAKVSESKLPGAMSPQGLTNNDGVDFKNGEWYEMTYLYQKTGATTARAGAWVRQFTVNGQRNPQAYKWWAADQAFNGPSPLAEAMELGGNKNHGNQYEQWVIWGPWQVVDGTKYYNPWGVPGI